MLPVAAFAQAVLAQTASPSPAPSPSPTASPRPLGVRFRTTLATTFVDDHTSGDGRIGPEAPGFVGGSPLSPNTPYDLFSSAPLVPGIAGVAQLLTTPTYRTRTLDVSLTGALGYVVGSVTNAAYWGENLIPPLNPHVGALALPYRVAFPTAPGQDDTRAVRLSVLGGSIATADGALALKAGYFDLAQTDRFVFAPPALTSVNPAIAYAPTETLGSAIAGSDVWQPLSSALPLDGLDLVARRGQATLELAAAALPSLPGTSARVTIGSLVVDRGEGTRYSAELVHATTGGAPFTTTVPFGANPQFASTPQGTLPTSTLSGQQQTLLGLRAAVHLMPGWGLDAVGELGRAWYDAHNVALPGTARPGTYAHLGFAKAVGRAAASLDLYRMDARYATMILPYGVPENQWSAAFAWPGQWLKSNYQLIDNSVLGVNREGYRIRYFVDKGSLEWHLEFTDLRQIEAETTDTALQTGFVDGYYLPQLSANATFGRQKRYAAWIGWHPRFADVTLDLVDDQLSRTAVVPGDLVAYDVPEAMLTVARRLSPSVVAALGAGRYAMKGTFSEPIDFAERVYTAGAIVAESPQSSLLVTLRRTTFGGLATFPASPRSPAFTGTLFLLEQRLQF